MLLVFLFDESGIEVNADHAAILCNGANLIVFHISEYGANLPNGTMRKENRFGGDGKSVVESLFAGMGKVNDHAVFVHPSHYVLSKVSEAFVCKFILIQRLVHGAGGPGGAVIPCKSEIAHAH